MAGGTGVRVSDFFFKEKLTTTPIRALPERTEGFAIYSDALSQGYGCVLKQKSKVVTYTSRQLKKPRRTRSLRTMS